jgi:hypothetical protein
MMRRAKRPRGDKGAAIEDSRDAMNFGGLDRLFEGHRGEDRRQPFR